MSNPLEVTVNGELRTVPPGTSVAGLLNDLGLANQPVAVERNRQIVPRAEHAITALCSGDSIEVVTFVGGG